MCTGIELTLLASAIAGGAGALFGGDTVVNPPSAEAPAIAAPTSRKAGADVRVGKDKRKVDSQVAAGPASFQEKRKTAVSLGGLGRSGLTL